MPDDTLLIQGAKGGKGGGGSTPTESPDSLRSKAYAKVVDLVSEGEIQGLVNGLKSVLLDGVPLKNADGSDNFTGYKIDWRYGTQGQTAMDNFAAQESESSVSVKVTTAAPVVRRITNASVDTVRVTLSFPALSDTNTSNGDVTGTSVQYAIDIQSNNGGYVQKWIQTVTGKASSAYQRSVVLKLEGAAPWDVKVRRITADSATQYLLNELWWASYTEIISTRLRYPNSAIVGLQIDAQQFSRIPVRGYDLLGLRVQVPSNYNPLTRVYTGNWNGTFTTAWTDNPAWCFYALVTNPRWGLGRFIDPALVNKWTLYTIAQYCDALVSDGKGGTEPRFTLNAYIQTREEAYEVVKSLASVFRGMIFWGPAGVEVAQDAPANPVALYTNANVIDGSFQYEETGAKQRYTTAVVQWNDPVEQFRAKQMYVEDSDGVARYGVIQTELVAFGCTSPGQATRFGKWFLYSSLYETEIVSFKVGMDGVYAAPGQIVSISDFRKARERRGGRVSAATTTTVTLDTPTVLNPGESYTLYLLIPDNATPVQSRTVTNAAGTHTVLNLSSALPSAPTTQSVWILSSNEVMPTTWRVLSVAETEGKNEYTITAVSHNPSKFAAIEQGLKLEAYPVSRPPSRVLPPTNLALSERARTMPDGTVVLYLNATWTPRQLGLRYRVSWRREEGEWVTLTDTAQQSVDIMNVSPGDYDVEVRTIGLLGNISIPVTGSITLDGKVDGPLVPDLFSVTTGSAGARLYEWTQPDPVPEDLGGFEVRHSTDPLAVWEDMTVTFRVAASRGEGNTWKHESVQPTAAGTYRFALKSIDTTGNYSEDALYEDGVVLAAATGVNSVELSSDSFFFKVDAQGNTTNTTVTLTALLSGALSGYVTWSVGAGYTGSIPSGTNTWVINAADQTTDSVTYTATKTLSGTPYSDSITIVRLRDGTLGITALLTNEAHTVPASSAGVVSSWAGAGGQMRVYRGATLLANPDVTFAIAPGGNPDGVAVTGPNTTGDFSVTGPGTWANGSLSTTVTFRATVGSATFDKVFSLTKAKQGVDGSGLMIDLSNDSFSIATAADGTGGAYGTATETGVKVYSGTVDDTTNWTFSIATTNCTATINGGAGPVTGTGTVTVRITNLTSDTGYVTITATKAAQPTLTAVFTGSKSKAGINSTVYEVRTSVSVVKKSSTGSYNPTTVTVSGFSLTGSAAPAAYSGRFIIATSTDGSTFSAPVYTSGADEASYAYTVPAGITHIRFRLYKAGGTTDLVDEETVPIITDGTSALQLVLQPSSLVFKVSKDGTPTPSSIVLDTYKQGSMNPVTWASDPLISGLDGTTGDSKTLTAAGVSTQTRVRVFLGIVDDTANWTFSKVDTSCTSALTGSGTGTVLSTVTNLSADSGYTTITASKSGQSNKTAVFTGVKSKLGLTSKVYELEKSVDYVTKTSGVYNVSTITVSAFSLTRDTSSFPYFGRFIIATSTDGVNYSNTYTSAADELSYTYTIPANISHMRFRLYQAGGTSTLLDEEIVPILTAASGVYVMTLENQRFAVPTEVGGTGGVYGATPLLRNRNSVQITATMDGVTDKVTIVKLLEGSDAITAVLSNESHTVPTDSAGNNPNFTGASTTMTVYIGAVDDSANWTYVTSVSGVTISGANTRTVTITAMSADAGYVDITASKNGYASITKRFTVVKSKQGTSALIALLTNEAHVLPASAAGVVSSWAGAGGTMEVYQGTTKLTSGVTFAIQSNPDTVTASINSTSGVFSATAAGSWADASNVTTIIFRATHTASGTTLDKTFTLSKSRQGSAGSIGDKTVKVALYQWAAAQPGNPSGNSTYTWATSAHSAYTGGNGWVTTPPTNPGTAGLLLWVAEKAVTDVGGATSTTVSWTSGYTVVAVSANGAAGTPGFRNARVRAYRWALTIPAAPTGTATYTWATGAISAYPSGWTADAGNSPVAGYTLWEASVNLFDSATTATSTINWGTSSILAAGYAGAAGLSQRIAYAKTTASSLGSGQIVTSGSSSFPPDGSWGANGWSATSPTPVAGESVYQTNGIYNATTNQTTWEAPFLSTLKVGSLSAITINTGALTVNDAITVSSTGHIRGGQTAYDTGSGFFLGYSAGAYKFSLGSGTNSIKWDGTTLTVPAAVVTGTFTADRIDTRNLTIKDATGKIIFASTGSIFGAGVNMIYNADFSNSVLGAVLGWRSGYEHLPFTLNRNVFGYYVQGEGTLEAKMIGTVTGGPFSFDLNFIKPDDPDGVYPVVPNKRYEASAYLNCHRCAGEIHIVWYTSARNYISETGPVDGLGNPIRVTLASGIASLFNMERSLLFATAPSNAALARILVRSYVTNQSNPTTYVSRVYFGEAGADQTEASPFTPGAGMTKITPQNIGTFIDNLSVNTLQVAGNAITVPVFSASYGGAPNANVTILVDAASLGSKVVLVGEMVGTGIMYVAIPNYAYTNSMRARVRIGAFKGTLSVPEGGITYLVESYSVLTVEPTYENATLLRGSWSGCVMTGEHQPAEIGNYTYFMEVSFPDTAGNYYTTHNTPTKLLGLFAKR